MEAHISSLSLSPPLSCLRLSASSASCKLEPKLNPKGGQFLALALFSSFGQTERQNWQARKMLRSLQSRSMQKSGLGKLFSLSLSLSLSLLRECELAQTNTFQVNERRPFRCGLVSFSNGLITEVALLAAHFAQGLCRANSERSPSLSLSLYRRPLHS